MTHLVAEANDLALMDDRMRVGCFKRTGLLMEYAKSKFDDDIKPQGVVSKIVVPDSHKIIDDNLNNVYLAPTESVTPESQHGAIEDSDIHPDGVSQDKDSEDSLVIEEDEEHHLLSTENLDDVEDAESDDEFPF